MLKICAVSLKISLICGVVLGCGSALDSVGGGGGAAVAGSGGSAGELSVRGEGGASPGGTQAGQAGAGIPAGDAGATGEASAGDRCASRFATGMVSFSKGNGPTTGQALLPDIVLGPPKGAGEKQGSLDVATLGNGGSITLSFDPSRIIDGDGADFIVFENAFNVGGDPTKPFAELATVEVSDDGVNFHGFKCTATEYPYGSCAGWHPVYANADTNHIDPTDPKVAGGDAFDLADLGLKEVRFVRITDRADLQGLNGTFDLDAVSIVHASCP